MPEPKGAWKLRALEARQTRQAQALVQALADQHARQTRELAAELAAVYERQNAEYMALLSSAEGEYEYKQCSAAREQAEEALELGADEEDTSVESSGGDAAEASSVVESEESAESAESAAREMAETAPEQGGATSASGETAQAGSVGVESELNGCAGRVARIVRSWPVARAPPQAGCGGD